MDHNELVDKITKQVMEVLKRMPSQTVSTKSAAAPQTSAASKPAPLSGKKMTQSELASYIDHTLLKPEAVQTQFEKLCEEAIKYRFKSVCVNSSWVPFVARKLRGSGVKICAVVGFPLGEMDTRSKAFESRSAIDSGADELDMVINVGALKSGNYKLVEEDIRAIKRACRKNTILKVIIETGLLTEQEKIYACEISKKAEADFVKTSTGFLGGGATVADIILMRRIVGPKMGVKASGGIKDFNSAVALIEAGATRLGCGASVAIITGAQTTGNY